nr:hypothetical protein [uncultured Acetobacterium sp.]
MLNSAQIKELFEKEAVAFLEWEGVPIYRAIELFGIEAVDAGMDEKEGKILYCGYKIEGGWLYCLVSSLQRIQEGGHLCQCGRN